MSTFRLLFLFGLAAATPADAAKGYHFYYDENGLPVYSQFAPGEGQESRIVQPPPPPAEPPEVAQERLRQQLQKFEDNREDEALANEEAARLQDEAAQARQRCEQARRNLEVLDGSSRQLYQSPDGTVTRLTEDERQQRRVEMEQIIARDCK